MIKTAERLLIVVAFVLVQPAFATESQLPSAIQSPALDDLKATLSRIREEAALPKAPADAGALVTQAKRQLRQWVERQLPLGKADDIGALNERLNAQLGASGLTGISDCSHPDGPDHGPPETMRSEACGYVDGVDLRAIEAGRDGPYLALTTSFDNARCGVDGSAYLYQFRGGHWNLVWENEENAESATYSPAPITSVVVARRSTREGEPDAPPPLVLTLSWALGCESFWGGVRFRLWRVHDGDLAPPPLISKEDGFYMGNERFIDAQLLPDDLLVEYRNRSVDAGVHNRAFVYHFLIGNDDKVQRVAPVALNPRDFVDEWLTQPWEAASSWTDARSSGRMHDMHEMILDKSYDRYVSGEFAGPPLRCRDDSTLWQIGFYPSEGKDFALGPELYFVIRWMAPYRFTMLGIRHNPRPRCNVADPMPDAMDTLFSVTGNPWPSESPFESQQ